MKKRHVVLFSVLLLFLSSCSPRIDDCSKYKTPDAKNACIVNLAVEKKDIFICREGPQNCLSVMWREFPEESVCMGIENPQTKDQCYSHVAAAKKNAGICRQVLEREQKDSCIYVASRLLQNASSCHEIANISVKDKCLGIYYRNKAAGTCDLILNSELRADCTINVAAGERNYSICDSMVDQFRDKCYKSIAAFYGDVEKCRLILSPEIRDFCIRDAARISKDGSNCELISNSTIKDECYRGLAIYTKNNDFCSSIADENIRKMCFDSV